MKTVFYNGRIFTGDDFIDNAYVEVEGQFITAIEQQKPKAAFVDLEDGMLIPAFIDIQLYGGHNKLFGAQPSVDALRATVEYSLAGGAANILPTVATNSQEVMIAAIEAVRSYWQQQLPGVIGLHLEGPFISSVRRGAHIPEFIRTPSLKDVEQLMHIGKDIVKMMTLAPEVCSPEIIEYLQQQGVIISVGHTDASFEQASAAFENGIYLATHLFNVMSPLHHRAPGVVGAVLYNSTASASIVADGHHVDYAVIAIAKRIMGERLFLITDAVTETSTGAYPHKLQDDKYVMPDGTLSGSALTMLKAVLNCVDHAQIGLEEAFRMASLYPARVLKLDNKLGRIAKGYHAHLLWLDQQLQVKAVYTNGSLTRMTV